MKIKTKRYLTGLLAAFILIQFISVDRTNPKAAAEDELAAPSEVMEIFRHSCYSCHSNDTEWPFYSYIAPASWLIVSDVNEGREEFNFSEWNKIPVGKITEKKKDIWEEISEGEMPLDIYLLLHPNASLSVSQKEIIKKWVGPEALRLMENEHDDDNDSD